MTERVAALLARSPTEIDAARSLSAARFELQSASRSYDAAFYAAEAALLAIGETRSKHSGVISAFGRLVVKDGGMDPEIGGLLHRLFEVRNAADYYWLDRRTAPTGDPIGDAERFVAAVDARISAR